MCQTFRRRVSSSWNEIIIYAAFWSKRKLGAAPSRASIGRMSQANGNRYQQNDDAEDGEEWLIEDDAGKAHEYAEACDCEFGAFGAGRFERCRDFAHREMSRCKIGWKG